MNLHRAICDTTYHLAREQLAARCLAGDVILVIPHSGSFKHHAPRRVGFHTAVSEHGLDQLEICDWSAELFAVLRIFRGYLQQPVRETGSDRRYM